jgi:hypothetical protein
MEEIRLMDQKEPDREMHSYFKSAAAEKIAKKLADEIAEADRRNKISERSRSPNDSFEVGPSQSDMRFRAKMLAAMRRPLPPPPLTAARSPEPKKSRISGEVPPDSIEGHQTVMPEPEKATSLDTCPKSAALNATSGIEPDADALADTEVPLDEMGVGELGDSIAPPKVAPVSPLLVPVTRAAALFERAKAKAKAIKKPASEAVDTKHLRFPIDSITSVRNSTDAVASMKALCIRLAAHKDYLVERDDYCHLAIRINLSGKLAPAFRPELKSGAAWGNSIHKLIQRDQVVIDLHWCNATKMPLRGLEPGIQQMFDHDQPFPFDVAWTFASKNWTNAYRSTSVLSLTLFQQCQLLKLRGSEFEAVFKGLSSGWHDSGGKSVSKIAVVKCQIAKWAERDKRIQPQRESYEKLWLAREALGHTASKQLIAELHAFMVGTEIQDRTSIRDQLKSLDKQLLKP